MNNKVMRRERELPVSSGRTEGKKTKTNIKTNILKVQHDVHRAEMRKRAGFFLK